MTFMTLNIDRGIVKVNVIMSQKGEKFDWYNFSPFLYKKNIIF